MDQTRFPFQLQYNRAIQFRGLIAVLGVIIGLLAVIFLITPSAKAYSVDDFVLKVDTRKAGETNTYFVVPTAGDGYNYTVDCDGDGPMAAVTAQTGNYTCEYATPGVYTVVISGEFPQIAFGEYFATPIQSRSNVLSVLSVEQWGTQQWRTMEAAFHRAENLTIAPNAGVPDLSRVASMSSMFESAYGFTGDLSNWDVSNVTDTSFLFYKAFKFNSDISNWDVSNVTNMEYMFMDAAQFNQDVSGWSVGNVTNMEETFSYALAFNQGLSNWDVRKVVNMSGMFMTTVAFNQDLSKWQIPSLQEAYAMFTGSRLSTVNYDKLLISWSQQSVQPDVYFDGAALYCNSAEAQNILTSPPNNWVINNFMSGNEYHCTEPVITGVDFSQENGKKILTVTGENLLYGINDEYWMSEGPMFFGPMAVILFTLTASTTMFVLKIAA